MAVSFLAERSKKSVEQSEKLLEFPIILSKSCPNETDFCPNEGAIPSLSLFLLHLCKYKHIFSHEDLGVWEHCIEKSNHKGHQNNSIDSYLQHLHSSVLFCRQLLKSCSNHDFNRGCVHHILASLTSLAYCICPCHTSIVIHYTCLIFSSFSYILLLT